MEDRGPKQPFLRRHRWITWMAAALLVAIAAAGIAVSVAVRRAEPFLRVLIVDQLAQRFHARVELDSFHFSISNGLWAEGKGLRIWPPAEAAGMAVSAGIGAPRPLIALAEFRFHAPLRYVPGKPISIDRIELRGLDIDMPPGSHFTHQPGEPGASKPAATGPLRFEIGSMTCAGAELTLETSKPGKLPLTFAIQTLNVTHIDEGGRMNFDAVLSIPKPKGLLSTHGALGPWESQDPGSTPVSGSYRLANADLSVFKGVAGTLSSTGGYLGTLRELVVDGETDTPNFSLTHFGAAEALHTGFHAFVDGTSGDTRLEPVHATLGQSKFVASGQVARVAAVDDAGVLRPVGHKIDLDVRVDAGRIEDFLRLTSRGGDPLLTGALQLQTTLDLPPGHDSVEHRLNLKGRFELSGARFSNAKVQQRIAELSLRGQGKANELKSTPAEDVRSTMKSDFTLAGGVLQLPALVYMVPGAEIDLQGAYALEAGTLDFDGAANLQATVSQIVGGWKGKLLKPADSFFKKGGAGTRIGVHISGTREDPHFGVDL